MELPRTAGGITTLYSFRANTDGWLPFGGVVIDEAGDIFGTTAGGGAPDSGTVFELVPSGSSYTESIVHTFSSDVDGSGPMGSPFRDDDGNLFVTTVGGGPRKNGTIVKLSPSGSTYAETALLSLDGKDGTQPASGFLNRHLRLFTTAQYGGKYGFGDVLALTTSSLKKQDVYDFKGSPSDAGAQASGLAEDATGALYGTTRFGGSAGDGTVFKLMPSPQGVVESVLWNFKGGSDGSQPLDGVIIDGAGSLYGTTTLGGKSNDGVVFKLILSGGSYEEKILHTFTGGSDGANPVAGLTVSGQVLWGTTSYGGGSSNDGTIFQVSPLGSGYSVRYAFNGSNGSDPWGGLTLKGRVMYGTTTNGGADGAGSVYSIPSE
jgi:uncharacterized repeat protein (TIGR03803 family)